MLLLHASVVMIALPIALRRLQAWYYAPPPSAVNARSVTPKRLALPALQTPSDCILAALVSALVVHALTSAWRAPRDLFLATRLTTDTSTATLRAAVAGKQLRDLAWRAEWGEVGLERILRRVSSWEGRKLYLLLGAEPLIACTFCASSQDYTNYALFTRTPWYALHLIVVGLLTLPTATLSAIDAVLVQLLRQPTQHVDQRSDSRDRSYWRRPACWALLAMLIAEASTLNTWASAAATGTWKDHVSITLVLPLSSHRAASNHPLSTHTVGYELAHSTTLARRHLHSHHLPVP